MLINAFIEKLKITHTLSVKPQKKKTVESESESERREREKGKKKDFSLVSKIYGNRTIGFRWSKRQNRSTYRELIVGTKILEFRQAPRGREFSYLGYF